MPIVSDLKEALQLGLSVVSESWNYKTKNWVTSVHAIDFNNDGDIEIFAGSRDGRVYVLTARGDYLWERNMGSKMGIEAIVGIPSTKGVHDYGRLVVGTREGKIYVLDKDGRPIGKGGKGYATNMNKKTLLEAEHSSFWYSSDRIIRRVCINFGSQPQIIVDSEDHSLIAIDYTTGELNWTFAINGWVSAIFSYDIDGDGEVEILVGSSDQNLYVLNHKGHCVAKCDMPSQIQTIFVTDLDHDGEVEILLGMQNKELVVFSPRLECKWRQSFKSRFLSIHVSDIDSDGINEILVGSEDKHLYILDIQGREIWRHYLAYRITCMYAMDVDRDGQVEVIIGLEDGKLHTLHLRLIKGLENKIRYIYQTIGKLLPSALKDLSPSELTLLQDIIVDAKRIIKPITLKQVEYLFEAQEYVQALSNALLLEQQKVQILWQREQIDSIRSLCFGDISGDNKRKIIIGTDKGRINAFASSGKLLWSLSLNGEIVAMQTGYLDRGKWEEILTCTADHLYVISGVKKGNKVGPWVKRSPRIADWMSSLSVVDPRKLGPLDLIIGSKDKKIYVYGSDLETPINTITTTQGIRTVWAFKLYQEDTIEIIAGSTEDRIYAFTGRGIFLWEYRTTSGIETLCVRDIDADGKLEIIAGSEDHNVYILDSLGYLKWRYYLPTPVLTVDAFDVDNDGKVELLAGCEDGYLYVFSRDGDLLWTYQSRDRIHVVRAEDINDEGRIEIAVASEYQLDLLQVVNQERLRNLISECWSELQAQKPAREIIQSLLSNSSSEIQAFALGKLVEQATLTAEDFGIFEAFIKDGSIEVRKSLIRAVMTSYAINPPQARYILDQLSMDAEQDIRLSFVKHISTLMRSDWEVGFGYLQHFSESTDQFVRRAVIRKLFQLIEDSYLRRKQDIFNILLKGVLDENSPWVQQEAARTLAHFFDFYLDDSLMYIYTLIVKGVQPEIILHIAHQSASPINQRVFLALVSLISDLDDSNVSDRLELAVATLEDAGMLRYGDESRMIYRELHHLLNIRTIEDMAQYLCTLNQDQLTGNLHFLVAQRVLLRLNTITRMLRLYLRREGINDRLTLLLEVIDLIDKMNKFLDQEYINNSYDEALLKLPDYHIFQLILKKWQNIISAELIRVRGKANLVPELRTKHFLLEEQTVVWLAVHNQGRSAADKVYIVLLQSDEFIVIGKNFFEAETIFAQDELLVEFTIKPLTSSPNLMFEIVYRDAESSEKVLQFSERLELQAEVGLKVFAPIPNYYSTGTPIRNPNMFYGREEDLMFLRDNLTQPFAKTLLILYGQRRAGKTTLLYQLVSTPILEPHIPILVDMQRESWRISVGSLFRNISFYIAQALESKGIFVQQPPEANFDKDPTLTFDIFLDEVERNLGGKKIIMLIDEFEVLEIQVERGNLAPELFAYLRSLIQHRQSINFLLSGTHTIEQLAVGYWSIFFNMALHYRLSKLSEEAAITLITEPIKGFLEYDPHAILKIRQLTADQPYLIHLLCRHLIDYCNMNKKAFVTINDVNAVVDGVMLTGQYHFEWVWDQISSQDRYVLSIIAKGGKDGRLTLSLFEIEDLYKAYNLKFKRDVVFASLKNLLEREIIEIVPNIASREPSIEGRYRIPVGLISRWLQETKPLEQVMHEEASA